MYLIWVLWQACWLAAGKIWVDFFKNFAIDQNFKFLLCLAKLLHYYGSMNALQ